MNRKTIFISLALVIVILLIALFFLWPRSKDVETVPTPSFGNCLVFQSDNSEKPCYVEPNKQISSTPSYPNIQIPTQTSSSSTTFLVPDECTHSTSVFERNDCVTKTAITAQNTQFCTLISSSLAQSACMRDVAGKVIVVTPPQNQSYDAFLRSTSNIVPTLIKTDTVVSSPTSSFTDNIPKTDPRFTAEALTERFKSAPLALFGVSPYQVRPGGVVTLQGTGFSDSNEIHVGGYSVTESSADGFTLSFSAPASSGEYDIWVTNSNGSSQVAERPLKITITDNPAPLPVVTSVTPNPANYGDTITIVGTGFSGVNTLSTSLGIMQNVASSGGAIMVRLSDFSLASQIKDIPYVKGKKVPILLYIQSDGGLSKEVYSFDVQF